MGARGEGVGCEGRFLARSDNATKRAIVKQDFENERDCVHGLLGRAGTPCEIIARLHKETVAILRSTEGRERLAESYVDVVANAPEEFAAFIKAETVKWARVAKAVGITPE